MSEQLYYDRSMDVDVYPHLKLALEILDPALPREAVDVGCGAGRDALFLIERGFRVYAYDKSDEAIARLSEQGRAHLNQKLFPQVSHFEAFDYPSVSLVSACSSLFFCSPAVFSQAWMNITESLLAGGVFCGHFMGPNDSWAKMGRGDLTVHSLAELKALLQGRFNIIDLYEHDAPGMTLIGRQKHWHTYSVVARKNV